MLVVRQRFLTYGLAPILYNTGIVVGTVALSPSMGIMGAAVGTVLGALLHLGVRVLESRVPTSAIGPGWPSAPRASASTCACRSPRPWQHPSSR